VFLTATEVGQQPGIRKSRVYELAAAGLLPVVQLGRRMRFPRRGLEELATAAIERAKAEVLGPDGRDGSAAHAGGPAPVGRRHGRRVA
jgi:excisionase family DNA binding protein